MKNNEFGDELDPIVDMLTPKASPGVPENLKSNVLSEIKRRRSPKNFFIMKNKLSKIAASAAAVAAVAVVVIVSVKPLRASAAEAIIDRSLANAGNVTTMVMKIDVRTAPKENFAYIDVSSPMVEHTLTVRKGAPSRWRLDKKDGRSIVFDGKTKYMWGKTGNMGYMGNRTTDFEEWFGILLNPEMVMMQEKAEMKDKGTKYTVEETADEIIIKADVKAKGNFWNSYLWNTSIEQSNTRREFVFDRSTELIKGLRIFVKESSGDVLVLNIKDIRYDVPLDESLLTEIPAGYEWHDVTVAPSGGKFAGIPVEKAARMIADAMMAGDMTMVVEAFPGYDIAEIGVLYENVKLVRLGESFKSGQYPGVFAPFEVTFSDGKAVRLNLALRNDNPNGAWVVDGGI